MLTRHSYSCPVAHVQTHTKTVMFTVPGESRPCHVFPRVFFGLWCFIRGVKGDEQRRPAGEDGVYARLHLHLVFYSVLWSGGQDGGRHPVGQAFLPANEALGRMSEWFVGTGANEPSDSSMCL